MTGGVRRATLTVRVVAAMLLAASTLVWMPAGAWTSDDGNVSVFTGNFANNASLEGLAVAVDGDGNDTQPDDTETTETP